MMYDHKSQIKVIYKLLNNPELENIFTSTIYPGLTVYLTFASVAKVTT